MIERIRCFIAVELDESIKRHLSEVQEQLRATLPKELNEHLRWVAPQSIHLTLKFLGGVPAALVANVQSALQERLAGEGSATMRLRGVGMFPSRTRPRVIWVGIEGNVAALARLQGKVEEVTVPLGFASEARALSPHLTLARVRENVSTPERAEIGRLVASSSIRIEGEMAVQRISLMRSELRPGGARYSRIAAIELQHG